MSRSIDIPMISIPGAEVPPDVRGWLQTRGWYPIRANGNEVWTCHRSSNLLNFTWEQAVAYEFYLFAALGGNDNGQDAP